MSQCQGYTLKGTKCLRSVRCYQHWRRNRLYQNCTVDQKGGDKETFQVLSDIHLEFSRFGFQFDFGDIVTNNGAKYLLMAGDIGYPDMQIYEQFIRYCSKIFEKVFIVAGNHEYYATDKKKYNMSEIDNMIEDTIRHIDNVYYLNMAKYEIDDNIIILGCTLWTHVDEPNKETIQKRMGDYRYIHIADKLVTVDDTNRIFDEQFEWLKYEVENNKDKTIIIMTHHLPSEQLIVEKYSGFGVLNQAFYTELGQFITGNPQIKYWVCGHSHITHFDKIGDTEIIINARGTMDENPEYNKALTFEL